jgi:hypothetical protein
MNAHSRLPPTSLDLLDGARRPCFLCWTDATAHDFKQRLAAPDPGTRAYWMGALLREANTRDVWIFVAREDVRALWPRPIRHLGRSREMWAWLPRLPIPERFE